MLMDKMRQYKQRINIDEMRISFCEHRAKSLVPFEKNVPLRQKLRGMFGHRIHHVQIPAPAAIIQLPRSERPELTVLLSVIYPECVPGPASAIFKADSQLAVKLPSRSPVPLSALFSHSSYNNASVYSEFLKAIAHFFRLPALLFHDSAGLHFEPEVLRQLMSIGLDALSVPPLCTFALQVVDLVNALFKARLRQCAERYANEVTQRPFGHKPSIGDFRNAFMEWMAESIPAMTEKAIRSGFETTGCALQSDGTRLDQAGFAFQGMLIKPRPSSWSSPAADAPLLSSMQVSSSPNTAIVPYQPPLPLTSSTSNPSSQANIRPLKFTAFINCPHKNSAEHDLKSSLQGAAAEVEVSSSLNSTSSHKSRSRSKSTKPHKAASRSQSRPSASTSQARHTSRKILPSLGSVEATANKIAESEMMDES